MNVEYYRMSNSFFFEATMVRAKKVQGKKSELFNSGSCQGSVSSKLLKFIFSDLFFWTVKEDNFILT